MSLISIEMAHKQEFTQSELLKLSKDEVITLAQSLHIRVQNLSKAQLIKLILGQPASVSSETQVDPEPETFEVFEDTSTVVQDIKPTIPAQQLDTTQAQTVYSPEQIKYELEIKRLEIEMEERRAQRQFQERQAQREFDERQAQLEDKKSQREFEKLKLEHDLRKLEITSKSSVPSGELTFKIESAAKLLPKLGSEQELEVYLITFRKIASLNNWPKERWSAILQTQLKGKALRIFAELPDSVVQDFDQLQAALLAAYELSPEHYRKKFRDIRKTECDTYTDFAFKMQNFFKRWLQSLNSYDDIDKLRQTLLMEQFLQTVSVELKIWLVDQKPNSIDEMAKLADQYVALCKQTSHDKPTDTQKVVAFNKEHVHKGQSHTKPQEPVCHSPLPYRKQFNSDKQKFAATKPVTCAYCKKPGHTLSECRKLKQKNAQSVANVHTNSCHTTSTRSIINIDQLENIDKQVHPLFTPYCKPATIVRSDGSIKHIQTLRDTGAMQSLLKDTHNSSDYTTTGETRLLKGITTDTITVPLVQVHLHTDFMDESVLCGLVSDLPNGIDFLIGNDIWLQTHPLPDDVIQQAVVTRSLARKAVQNNDTQSTQQDHHSDDIDQGNEADHDDVSDMDNEPVQSNNDDHLMGTPVIPQATIDSITDRKHLIELQKADPSLSKLRQESATSQLPTETSYYFLQDQLLMHHFRDKCTNLTADRIVVPSSLRLQVIQLGHDIPAAGHLGIRKTLSRLQPHFFWPRMLKDVTHFCKSCDTCQREGKGKRLPPAPLISVPVMSDPWTRIAIDIVGPLPVCPKTGNRFVLTCIDLATHYPEAIPLKQHTAVEVANALAQIFSHFGFPDEILSDQGTEFMSQLMQHFVFQFGISQIRASPYHPETNGSCERFHRTLKSMLRSMVDDFDGSWCECLPWVLFAYREIPVETLGFSPFELMYGYPVRGPLSLLRSTWLQSPLPASSTKRSVLQYILQMRERIGQCTELATQVAENARSTAKTWYDRHARSRQFDEGDFVLVLLPISGKPLQCKYQGPYKIVKQLGPVDYVISTPDKRKTERTCHVNMLKPYVQRNFQFTNTVPRVNLSNTKT